MLRQPILIPTCRNPTSYISDQLSDIHLAVEEVETWVKNTDHIKACGPDQIPGQLLLRLQIFDMPV